jgi:hypothetical protein
MDSVPPPPIVTQEIEIVDSQGRTRLTLSAKSGVPTLRFLQPNGTKSIEVMLDASGRPSVKLENPDPKGPTATFEIDDKGAHLKLDRPGGASAYLFLNNAGGSGVVFLDAKGARRLNALVGADGDAEVQRFGVDGKPVP